MIHAAGCKDHGDHNGPCKTADGPLNKHHDGGDPCSCGVRHGIDAVKADVRQGALDTKPDLVNHPPHYKGPMHTVCGEDVECIDVVETMTFNRGNAVKYLWRAGSKGGPEQEVEDLRKAAWYANREADRLERTPGRG